MQQCHRSKYQSLFAYSHQSAARSVSATTPPLTLRRLSAISRSFETTMAHVCSSFSLQFSVPIRHYKNRSITIEYGKAA
jgi:hypothetical protein